MERRTCCTGKLRESPEWTVRTVADQEICWDADLIPMEAASPKSLVLRAERMTSRRIKQTLLDLAILPE
ncbi:MAG: hypothetical protein AAFQ19_06355 [Pseudomonadota bacterium]